MGIQGLLPLLKSIHKPTHLREFAGQTIGIDAYGWLHRGTIACAIDLAQGKPTRKHIDFALNKVRMLIHFGVKPYLVFDGDYLPSKTHTEKGRAARRRESKRVGLELLRMGRNSQAQLELQKSIDVTPTMARELIEELKQMDVKYVVAPYEADSQLAYLERQGIVSGVLSEDSDLLVFGVQRLLTKLDQYGECIMINRDNFTACKEISMVGWSDREFRLMAMLSGCDYLAGIAGMGLKTSYRLVRKHKTVERVVRTVQFDGKMKVPPGYLEAFGKAEQTFLYQWVFCPEASRLKNLNELPPDLKAEEIPFIGKYVEPEIAAGVASGDLDPNTKKPITLPSRIQRPIQRTSTLQTPDEKSGKPITEFFKAHRVPLAELDINSFTPSPSQAYLLESQRNVSWSASQVPVSRPTLMTRFTSLQAPSSAPQGSRRIASESSLRNRLGSPKRQRLCSDTFSNESMSKPSENQESSSSPYFGNGLAQASPCARRKQNKKKEEFDLWSDDSAADALASVTETPASVQTCGSSSPRKRKKFDIFTDSPCEDSVPTEDDTSQSTIATVDSNDTQASECVNTPNTPLSSFSSTSQNVFGQGAHTDSGLPKNQTLATKTKVTLSTGQLQSSTSRDSHKLGFLKKFALQPDSIEEAKQIKATTSPSHADTNRFMEPSAEQEAEKQTKGEELLTDCGQDMSKSWNIKGSEDFLAPNSPEDSNEDENIAKSRLCFSKFAFAG